MPSKLSLIFVWALGLSLAPLPAAYSQTLFQNNNLSCEANPVLCTSGDCGFPDVNSVACRHVLHDGSFAGADFNGDGFTDCVAGRDNSFSSKVPELTASVLINKGAAAIACSPGPGSQFSPSLDYLLNGLGTTSSVSNVVAGDLNGGNSEFAVANLESQMKNVAVAPNGGTGFGADGGTIATVNPSWDLNNQDGFSGFLGQRTAALLDCNNDGKLDLAMTVEQDTIDVKDPPPANFRLNILRNDGSALQSVLPADSYDTHIPSNSSGTAALTVQDFNNDDRLDIALLLFTSSDGVPLTQAATVCINDGSCGFTCPQTPTINLVDQHPGQDPEPVSIEAGDFDGDGNADLVVSEPGLRVVQDTLATPEPEGLQYYYGNGDATFTRNLFVPYDQSEFSLSVAVLTTGCFNNDNVTDVAVTSQDSELLLNNIGIFLSDASGGIRTPFALIAAGGMRSLRGIDSADFDKGGGDDLIALAQDAHGDAQAFVFMNSAEVLSAIAGADQTGDPNVEIPVSGASCSISPEDATDPARFAVSWTVTAAPPGAAPTLSGANTLTPQLLSSTPGAYTLQLQCRTRCTSAAVDTKKITLAGIPPATPIPTPAVPSPTPFAVQDTQGGCLMNLTSGSGGTGGAKATVMGILALSLGYGWKRRKRAANPE